VILQRKENDSMTGGLVMVTTKKEAHSLIDNMSDNDFSKLCDYLNTSLDKTATRKAAEERFVSEVKAAEESVAKGNYVTLSELHEFLDV